MKRTPWLVLAVVVGLCGASAMADTVFNDFGSNFNYQSSVGWTNSGASSPAGLFVAANQFTAAVSGSVSQIDIANSVVAGDGGFTASLWTSVNNLPGTELGSWNAVATQPFGQCCAIVTISGISGVNVTAGDQYFLVLKADDITWNAWNWNSTGVTGLDLYSTDGVNWTNNGTQTLGAFDILTGGTGVPEPGTLLMLGSGALAAAGMVRRRLNF